MLQELADARSSLEENALVAALSGGALRVDGLHIPAGIIPDEDSIHTILASLACLHGILNMSVSWCSRLLWVVPCSYPAMTNLPNQLCVLLLTLVCEFLGQSDQVCTLLTLQQLHV